MAFRECENTGFPMGLGNDIFVFVGGVNHESATKGTTRDGKKIAH